MKTFRVTCKDIYKRLVGIFAVSRNSRLPIHQPAPLEETSVKSQLDVMKVFNANDNWLPTYEAHGFCLVSDLWTSEQIDRIRKLSLDLERKSQHVGATKGKGKHLVGGTQFVLQPSNSALTTARIVWAGSTERYLLEMGRSKKVLEAVFRILGTTEASHLLNQLHFKLPKDQVHFPWHQDIQNRFNRDPNFNTTCANNASFVQVITALERHTEDSGPIQVIPKSHQYGAMIKDSPEFIGIIKKATEEQTIQRIFLEKGETILCHPFTFHFSEPNNSSHSRLTFINGYCAVGANRGNYPGSETGVTVTLAP